MESLNLPDRPNESWILRLFTILMERGRYDIYYRCPQCGEGWMPHQLQGASAAKFCVCGASTALVLRWVGRPVLIHAGYSDRFEWLPEVDLPIDIRLEAHTKMRALTQLPTAFQRAVDAAVAAELPKRLDAEFEARVQARVEVELALRASTSKESPG